MMNTFGTLKNKILKKLTDEYSNRNMSEVKEIISLLKENKDIKTMYIFYENMEKKHIDDKTLAEKYINEISTMLMTEGENLLPKIKSLSKRFKDVEVERNEIYEHLDMLLIKDNLFNVDKKIIAKNKLVEYITNNKMDTIEENDDIFITNETLLYNLLTNNFNVLYDNTLSEDEKKQLKVLINKTPQELKNEVLSLKESVLNKIETLLVENVNNEMGQKLKKVKEEVNSMSPSKYNLYRLTELEMGLI